MNKQSGQIIPIGETAALIGLGLTDQIYLHAGALVLWWNSLSERYYGGIASLAYYRSDAHFFQGVSLSYTPFDFGNTWAHGGRLSAILAL
ncbi:hypothetical protein K2X33_04180 [bacterium]|nr:hypothetical protein [bacterium]